MKKITLLFLFLLTMSIGFSQQVLIEDFETSPVLEAWSGAAVVVGNDAVGSNGQNMEVTLMAAAGDGWQGAKVILPAGVMMDLTTDKTVNVDVYSITALTIMGKVESISGAPNSAVDIAHGGAGWETITFDFASNNQDGTGPANGEYSVFAVFPNRDGAGGWGAPVIGSVTSYDNLTAVLGVATCTDGTMNGDETGVDCGGPDCDPCPPIPPINIDFETEPITADFTNFDGGTATVIPNPQGSGNVGQMVRNGGATWAGSFLVLDNNPEFSTLTGIKMKVWTEAPIGTKISIKTEGGTGSGDKDAFTTVTSAWETLEYDFTGAPGNDTKLTFLFDFGNVGDGSATSTFLFDDIEQFDPSLGIEELEQFNFSIYPNPSNNVWNIKSNNQIISNVQVFDVLGKQVLSLEPRSNNLSIDASTLPKGLYFAKMTTDLGSGSIKLIKN